MIVGRLLERLQSRYLEAIRLQRLADLADSRGFLELDVDQGPALKSTPNLGPPFNTKLTPPATRRNSETPTKYFVLPRKSILV